MMCIVHCVLCVQGKMTMHDNAIANGKSVDAFEYEASFNSLKIASQVKRQQKTNDLTTLQSATESAYQMNDYDKRKEF